MNFRDGMAARARDLGAVWNHDLWRRKLPPAASAAGMGMRLLRLVRIVIDGFKEENIRLHALALTYGTLMSLVPLLALSLAVLKGLGFDTKLTQVTQEFFAEMPEQFQQVSQNVLDIVETTDFARLGGIGAIVFLFMAVQMLTRVERSFNSVFHVARHRRPLQRITTYVSVIVIVPVVMVAATTYTASIRWDATVIQRLGLLRAAPFAATVLAFSFLYLAVPNTRVRLFPAMVSGLLGASLWHFWFRLYIAVQPGVTQYNVLYGALASIPIFLAWLFVSWQIVLLGARIAFAIQNSTSYRPVTLQGPAGTTTRWTALLTILRRAILAFEGKAEPLTGETLADELNLQPDVAEEAVAFLTDQGILTPTAQDREAYVLTLAPHRIALGELLRKELDRSELPTVDGRALANADEIQTLVEKTLAAIPRELNGCSGSNLDFARLHPKGSDDD